MSKDRVPRIAGIGELLWDMLPSGPRLGGAVANFSVFSARLGGEASLISRVGNDALGHAAKAALLEPNLDLGLLQTSDTHLTGKVEVTFGPDKQPNYNIAAGAAWDFIQLTPTVLEAAIRADAICFGTLAQRHDVSRATIRGFVEATALKCVRVCDVNLRMPHCTPEILRWSLNHATIIKISDEELPMVFSLLSAAGYNGSQLSGTLRDAARRLLDHFPGCELVAMTLGANGSLLASREGDYEHPGFAIKLVDTVGAGDAFTAGLVYAHLRGAPLAVVAEMGNLCGSFVASQPGATPSLSSEFLAAIHTLLGDEQTGIGNQEIFNSRLIPEETL